MKSWARVVLVAGLVMGFSAGTFTPQPAALAQMGKKKKKEPDAPPPRPTDPKLIELHKEFLGKAQKLADDYERNRQHDKAREVYEAILRLVPGYPSAEDALKKIHEAEATTNKKQFVVQANKDWQDTGVVVMEGKPVIIDAKGSWTIKLSYQIGPDGIEMPKELRDFHLGALIAVVVSSPDPKEFKPFHVGEHKEFAAERTGKLMLRMFDNDPSDNVGQITVQIQSTFANAKAAAKEKPVATSE